MKRKRAVIDGKTCLTGSCVTATGPYTYEEKNIYCIKSDNKAVLLRQCIHGQIKNDFKALLKCWIRTHISLSDKRLKRKQYKTCIQSDHEAIVLLLCIIDSKKTDFQVMVKYGIKTSLEMMFYNEVVGNCVGLNKVWIRYKMALLT